MTNICEDCHKPRSFVCACGKPIVKGGKLYILKNKFNGKEIGVGDCCIGHFMTEINNE